MRWISMKFFHIPAYIVVWVNMIKNKRKQMLSVEKQEAFSFLVL